jgi:hypothetical protein
MSVKTNLSKYTVTSNYDAIVGNATDLLNGRATHTTLQAAHNAVAVRGTILILPTATTGAVVISKNVSIFGLGWGTQISGAVTFQAAANFCTLKNVRLMANMTIDNGSVGHVITEFFRAGVVITDNNTNKKTSLILGIGE